MNHVASLQLNSHAISCFNALRLLGYVCANIAVVEDQKQLDKFLQVCSVTLSESYTTPAAMLQIRYQ